MINIPKGTKDVLPSESYKWHYVENTVRKLADLYCLNEIRTPVFEHTELFLRGVGETTDVVNKEMYTFLDKGERSITLKPEGTSGVARSFIENGLFNSAMPLKTYYITPVFRYENPQKGRLREHHQFGVEVYGGAGAEILPAARRQIRELEALGFGGLPVCIAKTQASLSDDPALLGAPAGFTVTVRSVTVSAGAGFLVALTGDVLTMPGLPKVPAAENIDVDDDGRITGLF